MDHFTVPTGINDYMSLDEAYGLYENMLQGMSIAIPEKILKPKSQEFKVFSKFQNLDMEQILSLLMGADRKRPENLCRGHINWYDFFQFEKYGSVASNLNPAHSKYRSGEEVDLSIRNGHWTERKAFEWYESKVSSNYSVRNVHVIANPNFPGWHESPDGVVFFGNTPVGMIEVKSLYLPPNVSVKDFVYGNYQPWKNVIPIFKPNPHGIPDMSSIKGLLCLWQIQFGLLISNLPWCDLIVINSSNVSECEAIRIYRDDVWLQSKLQMAPKVWPMVNARIGCFV